MTVRYLPDLKMLEVSVTTPSGGHSMFFDSTWTLSKLANCLREWQEYVS